MKIIKIILSTLLAFILILCMGIFIFFETYDTDQYLPQITNKVSLALGRPVSIGHVGLGLSPHGITLDAMPLTIADDASFTKQPFVKVDRVRISVGLRALILHRKIHITDILLESPRIHFIRSMAGVMNVHSIGQKPSQPPVVSSAGAMGGQAKPFLENRDIHQFNPEDAQTRIRLQDASISFIDQSKGMPLDFWLTNVNAVLSNASLYQPFRMSFDASLYRNEPNLNGNALVSLNLSKRSVQISALSLRMDLSHLDTEGIKGISLQMKDSSFFKDISGIMQLNIAHLDLGASADFKTNGSFIITRGIIKHFNIIQTILSHTLGIFGDVGKLGGEDTLIERADTEFSFHDKVLYIDNSLIKTNILEFTAKGSMDQAFNMDMDTMLHLNVDISASLVNQLDGLKYFMDDSRRIAIGGSLKGVIPRLKYKPNKDFKKKSRKALIEVGGNILGALMGGK